MSELFAHVGGYAGHPDADRGSLGCPTIHPDDYEGFRKNFDFKNGETGEFIVKRPTETPPQGMGDLKPAEANRDQQDIENAKDYVTGLVYPWGG